MREIKCVPNYLFEVKFEILILYVCLTCSKYVHCTDVYTRLQTSCVLINIRLQAFGYLSYSTVYLPFTITQLHMNTKIMAHAASV